MKGEEFKVGGLYRLVRPDAISRGAIADGHGYLWLGERPGRGTARTAASGANFKSISTGEVFYFDYDEMDPVEQDQ
jgi:hypothetical protein